MARLPRTAIEMAANEASAKRCATVFVDILGWRSKVASAGSDPAKLAPLYRVVRIFTEIGKGIQMVDEAGVRQSSFSDHMVFTAPVDDNLPMFLARVGIFQLSAARMGFFIRGAVTIGDMIHDEYVVFGPALVTAYDLEQSVAVYPRIVLDKGVADEIEFALPYVVTEDDVTFLDPFNRAFLKLNQKIEAELENDVPMMREGKMREIDPYAYFSSFLQVCKSELLATKGPKEWSKIAWVYDRVAKDLGVGLRAAMFERNW